MNASEQLPETHRHKSERGQLTARGRSTDDGGWTTLLVVHEIDGSWTFHGLGAGVTLLAGTSHLLVADEGLTEGRWYGQSGVRA